MKGIKKYKSEKARQAAITELRRRGYNDFRLFQKNNVPMLRYSVNPNATLVIKGSN